MVPPEHEGQSLVYVKIGSRRRGGGWRHIRRPTTFVEPSQVARREDCVTIAGVPYGCAMWDTGVGSFSSSRPPGDAGACHVALSFDRAVDGRAAHAEQVGDLGGAVLAAVHQ